MPQITTMVSPRTFRRLRELALAQGSSLASVTREILNRWVETKERKQKGRRPAAGTAPS
jgi:hypothetical protein